MTHRSRAEIVTLSRRFIWPPYTSLDDFHTRDPLVIVSARGVWLEDADGKRYLEGNGSWWTNTLGHDHPRLKRVLLEQSASLMHCSLAGIVHEQAALLAEALVERAPRGLSRVFFSDNGSTAVEAAIKLAFQYWQQNGRAKRTRFVALSGAFHGETVGATSVSGVSSFRSVFEPLLFEVVRPVEQANEAHAFERAVEFIEDTLEKRSDEIAGVIVEPLIQGASGMRIWPASLLGRLREATRRADTFLIADEVFTGYGRTGAMWACDHAHVTPDLLCVAKAFSGGVLPMAATVVSERLYDGFRGGKDRAFLYGHTYCGNPLGAAVAREVLSIYEDEDVIGQVRRKSPLIQAAFEELARLPGVVHVRSLGLVGAADLGVSGYEGLLGWKVYEAALRRGAYLRPLGDTVYVAPALTIPENELRRLLGILHESVDEVMSSGRRTR